MMPSTRPAIRTGAPRRRLYAARAGDTGVRAYVMGHSWIAIEFVDVRRYLYDGARPGAWHVRNMLRLARQGEGLTTYINQHVRENYAARLDP
jgi:hypothetical protein